MRPFHHDRHEQPDREQTLVGISFTDPYRASEFLTAAHGLAAKGDVVLEDAVVLVKDAEGRTVVQETKDPQPLQSAMSGAVWAGLFGLLLGGPVGWAAGAALGAGAGAITAKMVDVGIPDEWVEWFREAVERGTTTVVLLLAEVHRDALVTEASRFTGAELVYANVDVDTLARIRQALGESAQVDAPSAGAPLDAGGAAEPGA